MVSVSTGGTRSMGVVSSSRLSSTRRSTAAATKVLVLLAIRSVQSGSGGACSAPGLPAAPAQSTFSRGALTRSSTAGGAASDAVTSATRAASRSCSFGCGTPAAGVSAMDANATIVPQQNAINVRRDNLFIGVPDCVMASTRLAPKAR